MIHGHLPSKLQRHFWLPRTHAQLARHWHRARRQVCVGPLADHRGDGAQASALEGPQYVVQGNGERATTILHSTSQPASQPPRAGDIPSLRSPQCLRFPRSLLALSMQMLGASRICCSSSLHSRIFSGRNHSTLQLAHFYMTATNRLLLPVASCKRFQLFYGEVIYRFVVVVAIY